MALSEFNHRSFCLIRKKNMKPDIIVVGICHPTKLNYLNQSLDSVDPIGSIFDKKILAIDEFNGYVFPQPFKKKFSLKNWKIIIDNHKSRPKSLLNAVQACESEWVFYNEDDIVLELPNDFDLNTFMKVSDGREPGMFSLTFGGTKHNLRMNDVGDMALAEENVIYSDDKFFCFRRLEETRDDFFFEFPGLFIRRDLLEKCLIHCMEHNKGYQIEFALSLSWFQLNLNENYYKASILKREFLDYRTTDAMEILHKGRFFKIIDPLQGHFAYGGNTNV
jgi:hypothetical protein